MMVIYFITVFLSLATAKVEDFGQRDSPGQKNIKKVPQPASLIFLASINTISVSRNTPGGKNGQRVGAFNYSTPQASFENLAHFRRSKKSGKIAELQTYAISKPLDQIEKTFYHQLEQTLVFLFKLVRILKKDTNFEANCIIFHSGRTVQGAIKGQPL